MLWAVPAILFGLVLRVVLTIYQPYAYWGSDSESYFSFAFRLLHEGAISIPQKRRLLYPIFLLPNALLPGSPLVSLLYVQHTMGLLTLIPLAYMVRKLFVGWKLWVIPVTAVYAGLPIIIWYEHELLGEAFFFATFIWAMAAWVAWSARVDKGQAARALWWIFLFCLALCVLTKPAGRFFWPGLILGLLMVRSWRVLHWPEWIATAALLIGSWNLGQSTQASRLLFTSVFPLTQLEGGKFPELKAEIAPMVRKYRERLGEWYLIDNEPKNLLSGDFRYGDYPAWQALDQEGQGPLYDAMRELAIEAILAEPHWFLYIGIQRTVGAVNWSNFKLRRFSEDYFPARFERLYKEMVGKHDRKAKLLQFVLDLPMDGKAPTYDVVREILMPVDRKAWADAMEVYVAWMTDQGTFVAKSPQDGRILPVEEMWPTPLGWWVVLGLILAVAHPQFRNGLGTWVLVGGGYAVGVHLVGSSNPRFFALVWPIFFLAMAVPADLLWKQLVLAATKKSSAKNSELADSSQGASPKPALKQS